MMKWFGYAVLISAIVIGSVALASCGGDSKPKEEQASEILNRGLQAHVDGRLDEAATAYHDVIAKDPQDKFAYYNLGVLDQTANRLQSAENNYRLTLNIDPDYGPALYNLAIIRAQAGSAQEAMGLYRHVIKINDQDPSAHYNLGLLLRAAGEVTAGDAEVALARSLNPKLPPAPAITPSTETSAPTLTPTR